MKPKTSPFILEAFLPYRLSVLTNAVSGAIASIYQAKFGLTIPEWRCMAVLGRFAPLVARDVAQRTRMDKVQVSRAIASLTSKGLAVQAVDSKDRRRSHLTLTAAGRRMHDRIVPLARACEAQLIASLSDDERATLTQILDKLDAAAEKL